eukprot:gene3093-5263_t
MKIKVQNEISPTITFEYDQVQMNESMDLFVMTTLKAPTYNTEQKRAAIDLVCVIDKSGSMEGEKLKLVKSSLNFMVEQLNSNDKLSIITFDTFVSTDLEICSMDETGKKIAKKVIQSIEPGTATNLSGGLFEAYDILQNRKNPSEVSSILLFTDGLANHGVTKTTELVSSVESFGQSFKNEVPIYTFGFGVDHDPDMLQKISKASSGLYYYVGKEDEIPTSFADCLGGLLSIVAQNIKVSIKVRESFQILSSLSSYKSKISDDNRYCLLQLGDIYSEETRDLIFIIKIPRSFFQDFNFQVIELVLSYYNVIDRTLQKVQIEGFIKRPIKCSIPNEPNRLLDQQRNRIETTKALEISRGLADKGSLDEARFTLKKMIAKIECSNSKNDEFSKLLIQDLQSLLIKLENKKVYHNEGSKWMHNFEESQKRQRCTKPEYFSSTNCYSNIQKCAMKKKFK